MSPEGSCSELSARPATRPRLEDAPEQGLEMRHEGGAADGAPGPGGLPEGGRPAEFVGLGEIRGPVRDGGEQRTIRCQEGVWRAVNMGRGARPGVVLGAGNQAGPDGVPPDVSDSGREVGLLQGTGVEAPLPEVPHPPVAAVADLGVAHMGLVEGPGEGVGGGGDRNEMDVVRHQAVRPDFRAVPLGGLGDPAQVPVPVLRVCEDWLPEVPPLRDVMGHSGGDDTSEAGRGREHSRP